MEVTTNPALQSIFDAQKAATPTTPVTTTTTPTPPVTTTTPTTSGYEATEALPGEELASVAGTTPTITSSGYEAAEALPGEELASVVGTTPATPVLDQEQIQEYREISDKRAQSLLETGEYEDVGDAKRELSDKVMKIAEEQDINELEAIKQLEPIDVEQRKYQVEHKSIIEGIKKELPSNTTVVGDHNQGSLTATIPDKKTGGEQKITYNEKGQKLNEQNFNKDGKKHGTRTVWAEEGWKVSEGAYKDGDRSGKWNDFHSDGTKAAEYSFKAGKIHGEVKSWHENGEIYQKIMYKDGRRYGNFISFHPDGRRWMEGSYKDGLEDGKWITTYTDGTTVEVVYKDGKKVK